MRKCPKFDGCSIPRCPLDYWMKERAELPEDMKCILRIICGENRTNRVEGVLSQNERYLKSYMGKKHKVRLKRAFYEATDGFNNHSQKIKRSEAKIINLKTKKWKKNINLQEKLKGNTELLFRELKRLLILEMSKRVKKEDG